MTNVQKTPLARTLPLFTQQKAVDEILKRGQALPGHVVAVSGPIVTIAFDVADTVIPHVTMPVFGPEYIRYPIQVGDKGVAFPCAVYIGVVTGLGGGAPGDTVPGNLSALVWFPCGNANWSSVNPNEVTIYGPGGVVARDTGNTASVSVVPNEVNVSAITSITLTVGAHSIVINASGVTIDGKVFLAHEHSAVQTGTGVSGPVA